MEISFTVPLVPPSVNHYVKHTRRGKHYVTKEAKAYKNALGWKVLEKTRARPSHTIGECEVEIKIFLGKRQRGDADNFSKVVLDGLVEAGAIRSDANVKRCAVEKFRDWANPRTEITVRAR